MEENIKKIICNILDRNIVIDNREDIRAYGMDSLLKVQLVIKIEEEFPRDRSSERFIRYRNMILNQLHFAGRNI